MNKTNHRNLVSLARNQREKKSLFQTEKIKNKVKALQRRTRSQRNSLINLKYRLYLKPQLLKRKNTFIKELYTSRFALHRILLDLLRACMQSMYCVWTSQQSCTSFNTQLHRILKITDAYRLRKFYLVEAIRSNLVDKRDKIIAQLHRLEYRV